MSRFVERALLFAAVSSLLVAGCGGTSNSGTIVVAGYPAATRAELATALQALCDVQTQLGNDPSAARMTFYDRAHTALHMVAGATTRKDRSLAAALLVAKQRVESDFGAAQPLPSTARDVSDLIGASARAARAINVNPPRCK